MSNPETMNDLIFDMQGNFIIIKALACSDNEKKDNMLNIISNLEPKIKKTSNGKTFLNKVYNMFHFIKSSNYKQYN